MKAIHNRFLLHLKWNTLGVFFFLLLFAACKSPQSATSSISKPLPTALKQSLEAHGGLERWNNMTTLRYTMKRKDKPEQHLVDLKSRKVHLTHEEYTLGFDGKEVWITPSLEAFGKGSPRFYHLSLIHI